MLESIIKQKTEPATFVLDALHNIVFTNTKADLFLTKKDAKKKILQLSKALIEEPSSNSKLKKISGIKLNEHIISLTLEFLQLNKNAQTYFLFKIEDDVDILHINNSKINLRLLNRLNKTEAKLEDFQKTIENHSREIGLYSEENTAINEELKHLNTKYINSISKLDLSNNQLNSFIYHNNIATIFLDEQLRVLKYSKAATKLFYIKKIDINRSIRDFKNKFTNQNWLKLLTDAFKTKKTTKFFLKTKADIGYNLLINFFKSKSGNTNAVLSFNLKTDEDFYYIALKNNIDAACVYDKKNKIIKAFNKNFLKAFEINFPKKLNHLVERENLNDNKTLSIFKNLERVIPHFPKIKKNTFEFNTSKNNLATANIECYNISKSESLIKLRNVTMHKNKFCIGETYLNFNFKYSINGLVIYNTKNGHLVYVNEIFKNITDLNGDKNYSIYGLISVQHLKAFRNLETKLTKKTTEPVSKIISIKKNDLEQYYTKVNLTKIEIGRKKHYVLASFVHVDELFKKAIQKECRLHLFETLFKKSTVAFAIYNINKQTFSVANNAFINLFEKEKTQIKQWKINDLLATDTFNKTFDFTNAFNFNKKTTTNLKYNKKNNSFFYGQTKLYAVQSKNNKFLIIQIEDISKSLKIEDQLNVCKKELDGLSKKHKTILTKGPIGIGIYDFTKCCFIEVNKKWLNILKCNKQQALNYSFSNLFFDVQNDGSDAIGLYNKIKKEFNEKGTFKGTIKLSLKNQITKNVDTSIFKINGSKNYATVILNDNTHLTTQLNQLTIQNKIFVDDLTKYKFFYNFSKDACGLIDINTLRLKNANTKLLKVLGLKQKEFDNIKPGQFYDEASNNISLYDFSNNFLKELNKGKTVCRELFILNKSKTPILINAHSTLLPKPNENLFYFTFRNIKEQRQLFLENQLNLATIFESKNRFNTLFNSAQDGFVVIDVMQQEIISCNPKFCKMFAYGKTNFLNAPINILLPKKNSDQHSITTYFNNVLAQIKESSFYKSTNIFTNKKGQDFYAEVTIVQLDKLNSNFLFIQFADKNIEMNTQKKLVKVESLYVGLFENSGNGIIIKDIITKEIFDYNQKFLEIFEEKKALVAKGKKYNFSKLIPVNKRAFQLFKQLVKSNIDKFEIECVGLKQKTKKTFYVKIVCFRLNSPLQNLVVISISDIDAIKNAELAVLEKNKKIELINKQLLINEEKFRLTFENANNFIGRTKLNGELIEHNNYSKFNFLNEIKSKPAKFIWNFSWFKNNSQTTNKIKKAYKSLKYKKKIQLQVDYKISVNIEGILELTLTKVYKNKKLAWILVEGNDITEITNFQNQLSLNEQKFKAIYDNSSNFIAIIELDGIIAEHNKSVSEKLEVENPVTTGIYLWDIPWFLKYKSSRQALKDAVKKAASGVVVTNSTAFDLPNYPNRFMQYSITPIFDENKEIAYLLGESNDVTEAIELNKAKALQQSKFNTFFKASKNAIIILDKSGVVEEVNDKGKKILSLTKLKFQNPSKYTDRNRYLKFQSQLKKHIKNALKGQIESGRITHQNSINATVEFEYNISPIFDNKNNVIKLLLEFTDVTNKVNDQLKLSESEKKFRAIFYNALNFISRLSPNGIVLEHNRYGHANIAFTYIKELIGKPIWEDKFLDKSKKGINQLKTDVKLCAKGNIISNEIDYYFKSKDNPIKLKYTLKPIFDPNKNIIWILLEGTNISNLRNTQNQLLISLTKSEYFFENSLVASVIVNKNLQLTQTNKAFLKITGYTAEEVNKIGYFNLLYDKDIKKAQKNIDNIHSKKFLDAKFKRRYISKSKQLKTAIFSFKPFYENGQFNGGYITLSDITELETKKQQLDDNIKKYKSLFDNNVTGLAVGDKKKFTTTKKLIKKDGDIIDTIVNISGVFNDEDEFLFDITSISDISEIKKLEAQLANKVNELEKYIESNLELENFAFLASHDLRAPLVTVLSFTKILQSSLKDKISKNEYAYLAHIKTGVNRLQQSIDDLLDFSSVSNNQLKIKSIKTKAWLNRILKDYEVLIENNKAKISFKKLPQTINIDESLYTRLIYNLISNSLKFVRQNTTPKIEIGCISNKNFHQFYCKDNGIGIPQKMQEKVFGIFKRLHPSEVYEGTGIGLALCKKVVERHNGKIWIESAYGRGTTFYFSLPAK